MTLEESDDARPHGYNSGTMLRNNEGTSFGRQLLNNDHQLGDNDFREQSGDNSYMRTREARPPGNNQGHGNIWERSEEHGLEGRKMTFREKSGNTIQRENHDFWGNMEMTSREQ